MHSNHFLFFFVYLEKNLICLNILLIFNKFSLRCVTTTTDIDICTKKSVSFVLLFSKRTFSTQLTATIASFFYSLFTFFSYLFFFVSLNYYKKKNIKIFLQQQQYSNKYTYDNKMITRLTFQLSSFAHPNA